jgi:hypothetical protein
MDILLLGNSRLPKKCFNTVGGLWVFLFLVFKGYCFVYPFALTGIVLNFRVDNGWATPNLLKIGGEGTGFKRNVGWSLSILRDYYAPSHE